MVCKKGLSVSEQSGDDSNSGTAIGQEKKSSKGAYAQLGYNNSCEIYVVNDDSPLISEEITLSKEQGITIEGVNANGDENSEVAIDCNVNVPTQSIRVGSTFQGGTTSNEGAFYSVASYLVEVNGGKVIMNSVKCTDETSFVTFSNSLFWFYGPEEVKLNEVEISKVNVVDASAINIDEIAGSTVSIGRTSKCTFKSCSASNGYSGAIYLDMKQTMFHLKLPAAFNLDIDNSNTAKSSTTSIFIMAPDVKAFCEQEDSFEFANEYDESAAGWIMGAKDEDSDPVDLFEKFMKSRQEKQKEEAQKKKAGTIVAIVVPIVVVVVVAVVVVVVVIIVVRKRKSKSG
ncbi:uncharacterized protein MONOS_1876 [Monocercomonoides exilis]|uniref:uncharacterized protein n=1 Tax=Monocercomonoides exilis TaxID=2049356 RepID=UPI00355A1615|nr:hypothetical protein MONOS_1876 [Monocercomonoides exilis]|eukprot:MONOS_1876.1-p1 / transcript=MONOS_1876.1 / gene=MONOS_1876 / organism=Monocercomonoides_exilis_PA203 / gene_product=unspecified product / transcript_product=unspecified product / location=Mono_scaffold00035:179748-181113(+) / protein_length=343 / sequence_SO=supercontig / SO=protein_coding / is_pseudo=false